jgi:HEAT repeat protein
VIEGLVEDMIRADFDTSQYLQDILIAIGSNEIALVLSENISHPMRRVRQQALRILAELGKATLRVFSDILMDDRWFERPEDRHELPDAKWYVLRNSIFVLGLLKDEGGIAPLRLRMTDPDVRIRREIVSALEKIGGEEAVDLLVLMAEDADREIREKAIIAVGVIGITDSAPLLIDVAKRNPSESIRVANALGKLGGHEARAFLTSILESEDRLVELSGGLVSKDDLRVAIIKALGNIGDQASIDSIRKFKDHLSTAQKIFFKQSSVQKTIADVLSRH